MPASSTTRRQFLAVTGAASAAATLGLPEFTGSVAAASGPRIRSDDLLDTGPLQRRWLSLPHSRIVVNATAAASNLLPAAQTTARELPFHLGYFAADDAFMLRDVATIYRRTREEPGTIEVPWVDNFDTLDPEWIPAPNLDVTAVSGRLRLNLQRASVNWWGQLQRWVEVDLDETPFLQIKVDSLEDAWGLRVHDGTQELTIQADSNSTGTFTYDVAQLTGWRGVKRFQVVIRVAVWDKPATFDFVRIAGVDTVLADATEFSTDWRPHDVSLRATHADGSSIEGFDVFHDVDSVVRTMTITKEARNDLAASPEERSSAGQEWVLAGKFLGEVGWDAERKVVTVSRDQFSYAVAISAPVSDQLDRYWTTLELLSDSARLDPSEREGWWALRMPLTSSTTQVNLAVGFATAGEGGAAVASVRARKALRFPVDALQAKQRDWWDKLLARVPHPTDFSVRGVPALGVTPEDVRREYYTAWVFVAANVLPPMPEVGFAFPQAPAGKPSLWKFGAPGAKASASWETMFAIQFLAYLDPQWAWEAFRGMMTLIEEDGQLHGEGLPTRKAQTAMILYQLTGDIEPLRETYPAVRRHLEFAMREPRWIFKEHDFADEKDAAFAFSVMVDMVYAADIAEILGMHEDVAFWNAQRESYVLDCQRWFWATPTADPVEFFREESGARGPGSALWISSGIAIDLWADDSPFLAGLMRRLLREYRPQLLTAGFGNARFPDYDFTTYGLLDRGRRDVALGLMNANLRDVVRANSFAETYAGNPPRGAGVRPSQNGVSSVVTAVWMNNGYRYDLGWPALVRMTDDAGGITGLSIRGKRLDVTLAAGSSQVELGGSFVDDRPDCRAIDVPLGGTVSVPTTCATG